MGEAFGLYRMGDDEALMPLISVANVAGCSGTRRFNMCPFGYAKCH
jgi:lactam utilization protein B